MDEQNEEVTQQEASQTEERPMPDPMAEGQQERIGLVAKPLDENDPVVKKAFDMAQELRKYCFEHGFGHAVICGVAIDAESFHNYIAQQTSDNLVRTLMAGARQQVVPAGSMPGENGVDAQ